MTTAIMLFAMGFFGRIALHDYHNIETIMVSIFLASMLLPGGTAAVVSISMIVLSDIYLGYFGNSKIILFTYSGFLLVSLITTQLKSKIEGKYSARTVYKFTASGIVFTAVLEKKMYALAIIGLLTTVISAFYYLKIIKTIYFDDSAITFEPVKNKAAQVSIFLSCSILLTFFLYPSIFSNLVNSLFVS